ncbi:MAG TPA: serine/threonine-protein kinase [Kofleriaceae bacterium]|nr:serine/threonine-protein kinase [Kofleriaceae bacterium]
MREGTTIGPYRILRKIGQGGMGAVFLGEHTLIGRFAAIKVLLPEMSVRRANVERFFNEARATTAVSDPGIVQVFDFGFTADNTAYIVMEHLEGEQVNHRLARLGVLTAGDALRLTRQVAGSLAAAHAAGIVHRDLKPENLFVIRDPEAPGGERPKILDFGIAKLEDDRPDRFRTRTGAVLGTPVYMSPEQCNGGGRIDHRSDIYSLGCVLYHLLTGQPPFDPPGMGAILLAHMSEPPRPPSALVPSLPPALDAVVLRCLAKAPDARFQSMLELQHACDELLRGITAGMTPTISATSLPMIAPPAVPVTANARRGRLALWIGVAALATTGGVALALATAGGKPSPAPPAHVTEAPVARPVIEPPPQPPPPAPTIAIDAGVTEPPPEPVRHGKPKTAHSNSESSEDLYRER